MIRLETKQSGGKLLRHSDLQGGEGGVFLEEASRRLEREMKLGTWNVRSLYGAGSLKAAARELGNRRERNHCGDLGVDGWIILGWISRRWDVGMWTGLGWHRIGTRGGHL